MRAGKNVLTQMHYSAKGEYLAEKKTRKNNENKTCAYFYGAGICIYWVLTKYSYLHLLIIDLINAIKAFKI